MSDFLMAAFLLKHTDPQGAVHERLEEAVSETAVSSKGVLIYSIQAQKSARGKP